MKPQPHKRVTHTLWVQEWDGSKFIRWRKAGEGYETTDARGRKLSHNLHAMLPVSGWNGYSVLMQSDDPPPDPPKDEAEQSATDGQQAP